MTTNRAETRTPPMEQSDEATPEMLQMAREQGEAISRAAEHMMNEVATSGGIQHAGDYMIGYAVEQAEGMYHPVDGDLEWSEPESENCHIEVTVNDAADKRFIPGLDVTVTVIDPQGNTVGENKQEFLWHPWLYHYGRNWQVPGDGEYRLRVRVEPPQFGRHDEKNGKRYMQPVEVEFDRVQIKTGQK